MDARPAENDSKHVIRVENDRLPFYEISKLLALIYVLIHAYLGYVGAMPLTYTQAVVFGIISGLYVLSLTNWTLKRLNSYVKRRRSG